MNTILLIEDEASVASFIQKGLREEGYQVVVAFNGTDGLQMAQNPGISLILLDIMLQDANGVEICRELRKAGIRTPVLFLTALGTPENVALGLDSGGDDYLVKPFKFIELNARIKALIRRTDATPPLLKKDLYQVGNLAIDNDARTVERGNQRINLTATEYRLLLVLIKNKGKVMSRIDLLENVWDISFNMGTNVVDVYINYLRKKIDTSDEEKLIHTVIGMGYVLKES